MTGKSVLEYSDHRYFDENYIKPANVTLGYSPIEVATTVTFSVALVQVNIFKIANKKKLISDTPLSFI